MAQAPSSREIAQLGQALMLGTRKRPIALPPDAAALLPATSSLSTAMLALVLAGQHARFEHPTAPTLAPPQESDLAQHRDTRSMMSEPSRRILKQLLALAKGDAPDAILNACRDRVAAHGLRLHPFDLPGLAPNMRGAPARTGPSSLSDPAGQPLDAEGWKAMPPDSRAEALRQFRLASPDAARALLEETFRFETAPHRAAFLAVLAAHLTPADLPFLESAAKDRAEAVRNLALRLAGSIPGTAAYRERLDRAAALFVTRGPKSQPERKLALPKALASSVARPNYEVFQSLEGLKLADLAARLDFTPAALLEALPQEESMIFLALMTTAAIDGDCALAVSLAQRLRGPRALVTLWGLRRDSLDMLKQCRAALMDAFIALALSGAYPDAQTLHAYYGFNGGSLSEPLAQKLLASESWRSHVGRLAAPEADNKTPNAVKETALLIPDSLLDGYLASIDALPPHLTLAARMFAEFCDSLTATTPVAPLTQFAT
jgi:hypothetical protein